MKGNKTIFDIFDFLAIIGSGAVLAI